MTFYASFRMEGYVLSGNFFLSSYLYNSSCGVLGTYRNTISYSRYLFWIKVLLFTNMITANHMQWCKRVHPDLFAFVVCFRWQLVYIDRWSSMQAFYVS